MQVLPHAYTLEDAVHHLRIPNTTYLPGHLALLNQDVNVPRWFYKPIPGAVGIQDLDPAIMREYVLKRRWLGPDALDPKLQSMKTAFSELRDGIRDKRLTKLQIQDLSDQINQPLAHASPERGNIASAQQKAEILIMDSLNYFLGLADARRQTTVDSLLKHPQTALDELGKALNYSENIVDALSHFNTVVIGAGPYKNLLDSDCLIDQRLHEKRSLSTVPFKADPLLTQTAGETRQMKRLAALPVERWPEFYFAIGDFDNFGDLNAVAGKPTIGSLSDKLSSDVIISKISLMREAREELARAFWKHGLDLHRYIGGDEFVVELYGAEHIADLKAAIQDFSKAMQGRHRFFRFDFERSTASGQREELVLSNAQIRTLNNLAGVEVVAKHGDGLSFSINRSKADDKFIGQLMAVIPGGSWSEFNLESSNHGLFTVSVGAISAEQLFKHLEESANQKLDYWTEIHEGKRVLRRDHLDEFYAWGLRLANDLLAQAKKQGKNQAFAPESEVKAFLAEPITSKHVSEMKKELLAAKQHRDPLSDLATMDELREWVEKHKKIKTIFLIAVDSYLPDGVTSRAFHLMQQQVGYLNGNKVIRLLVRLVKGWIGLRDDNTYGITRQPPDSFLIVSSDDMKLNSDNILTFFSQLKKSLAQLGNLVPRISIYEFPSQPSSKLLFEGAYDALSILEEGHRWVNERGAVGSENDFSDVVAKFAGITYIRFNPQKAAALRRAMRGITTAKILVALEALAKQRGIPEPVILLSRAS